MGPRKEQVRREIELETDRPSAADPHVLLSLLITAAQRTNLDIPSPAAITSHHT